MPQRLPSVHTSDPGLQQVLKWIDFTLGKIVTSVGDLILPDHTHAGSGSNRGGQLVHNTANTSASRAVADCHPGTAITNTPAGAVAATTVQAAINELDTEKLALAGGNMTGNVTADPGVTFDGVDLSVHVTDATAHHSNANDPTADEKAALNGGYLKPKAGVLPLAAEEYRGELWAVYGDPGVADTLNICLKSALDAYSWVVIATG